MFHEEFDLEDSAKMVNLGGNSNVMITIPEVHSFKITPEIDFIIIASDGVYDRLSNTEII